MSKPHASLSLTTNILLILVWGAGVAAFLFLAEPRVPALIAVVGAILGAVCGVMQHLSFEQARQSFSAASSLLEVRAAFKATTWGARYIRFLYICKFILLAVAFAFVRQLSLELVSAYLAGDLALMFVREIVTLRDTFVLRRLCKVRDVGGDE